MKRKHYKQILILLVSVLLVMVFLSKPTLADEINYCAEPTSLNLSVTQSSGSGSRNVTQSPWELQDGNDNTVGFSIVASGEIIFGWNVIANFFETAGSITSVEYVSEGNVGGSVETQYEKAYLYYNDQWNEINSQSIHHSKSTTVISGNWSNVSKLKLEIWIDGSNVNITSRVYQIRAFGSPGPVYIDIGLRVYNGTETVAIAAEPEGTLTFPLRIAKNGVIYGIVLVELGDPNDSGVRIQTSSGIKALRRF